MRDPAGDRLGVVVPIKTRKLLEVRADLIAVTLDATFVLGEAEEGDKVCVILEGVDGGDLEREQRILRGVHVDRSD